jgi:hypothetical protein
VAGFCEHGNEPSASIKCGELLSLSQEDLCPLQFVGYVVQNALFKLLKVKAKGKVVPVL